MQDPAPCPHAECSVSVLQGQGPRAEGMWFLHWWDQQMHQGHRAGLTRCCQPEPGHQGWHLCGGEHRAQAEQCGHPAAQSQHNPLPLRGEVSLLGAFQAKSHTPQSVSLLQRSQNHQGIVGVKIVIFLLPHTYYSDFLCWYGGLIEFLWCLAMWKPGLVSEDS